MSWEKGRQRWVKTYRGRRYKVSARKLSAVPTKDGSREQANLWWISKRAEIDSQGLPPSWEERQRSIIADLMRVPPDTLALKAPFTQGEIAFQEVPSERLVGTVASRFLSSLDIAPNTLRSYRLAMSNITEFLGKDSVVALVGEEAVSSFHDLLMKKIGRGEIGRGYAQLVWVVFGRFIRHLWSERYLEDLPRNLKGLRIKGEAKTVVVFTLDEVKTILEGATGFPRLCVLLALNCGMYPADIGDLRQSEVGWKEMTITRKRTKEKNVKTAPVVCYRLWPETFSLLQEYRSKDKEYVFTTRNGNPIYSSRIEDGKVRQSNGVRHILTKACECVSKPPKLLRHTGASLLEAEYPYLTDYYLGHAPETIKAKHYVAVSQEKFDEALAYLRERILG